MKTNTTRKIQIASLALVAGFGLLGTASQAQDQTAMAPPVSAGAPTGQNVYQWKDVPVNQQVQITRAVFDQGGYQLYASTGETIVVPFVNQNLYAMKFGQTSGGMYFINDGNVPTLFIQPGGYLENAAAAGAHWYPFPHNYAYTAPVYEGIAPNWSAYAGMGWYPGMAYYGGYYSYSPWHFGVSYSPFPGLYFSIGGHPYYGWNSYHSYYSGHPYGVVYVRSFPAYRGYSVGYRGPAFYANHAAFGRPTGYWANHGTFVHNNVIVRNSTTVHNNTFVHNSFTNNSVHNSFGHQSGSFGNTSGSFGRAAAPANRPFGGGGSFGHSTAGSFGHSPSGFGGSRAAAPAFGHTQGGGSFGRSAPSGGSSFGHGGGNPGGGGSFGHGGGAPSGGSSHGSFGGGSGGSHGSSGGGGGSHGSFGGGHH